MSSASAASTPTAARPARWRALASLGRMTHRMPHQMPREMRDTLFLLAVVAWSLAPHAWRLSPWCSTGAAALLLWRALLAWRGAPLPGRWTVIALLAGAAALTWWEERTLLGKEAGVTLLCVLTALKMLELRARRDALVIFFLGFFVVLTQFLYSQSLLTALHALVAVWGLLSALVLAHMPSGRPSLASAAGTAARAALLGLPVMVALFLLFPRIGPLWGLPGDAISRTGLSGTLRMGGLAGVAQDESVALRLRFAGAPPPPGALYFRGPVLSQFDGLQWTQEPGSMRRGPAGLEVAGPGLNYEMVVLPNRLQVLPLLELSSAPQQVQPADSLGRLSLRADLQWHTERSLTGVSSVQAQAYTTFRHGAAEPALALRDAVDLPAGFNPRTLQWAADLRRDPRYAQADARTLAQALLQHIRSEPFVYTLQPGAYGRNAVDEFWLDRRSGFCEHFAAAFVVLMRALDVPARIVTGYQGMDPVPLEGWWIVRQSHAHAWAEYWQPGEGWVRADPTAAVAPERVSRSRNLAAPPTLIGQVFGTVDPELLANLRRLWDRAELRWTQWVLSYSRQQQFSLMKSLGVELPDLGTVSKALVLLLSALAAAGAAWAAWDRRRRDPWVQLQAWVAQRLRKAGVHVAAHEGPRTRAQRLLQARGPEAEPVAALLLALEAQRYASEGTQPAGPPLLPLPTSPRGWRQRLRAAFSALPPPRPDRNPAAGESPGRSAGPTGSVAAWLGVVAIVLAVAAPVEAAEKSPSKKARTGQEESAASGLSYQGREDVRQFAEEVAQRHGLSARRLWQQLQAARRVPAVQRLIMPPPAGVAKNWAAYRERFVEPQRIGAGARFWREHARWLQLAEQRWGVPAWLVVGIVGVETFYGQHMGNFRVLDALATLSFDFPSGRSDRSAFFRSELEALLLLAHRQRLDPASLKGSYAGAMGLPQFMPGSLNQWALDFDGDGRMDLSGSAADAIGSVAHYLAAFGWQQDLPTHFEVGVPENAAERAVLLGPDIVPSFTAAQFVQRGATLPPQALSHEGLLALVELQNGAAAPSYVAGTRNFYVITRYNWSSYYAMAVIELGGAVQRLIRQAGGGP